MSEVGRGRLRWHVPCPPTLCRSYQCEESTFELPNQPSVTPPVLHANKDVSNSSHSSVLRPVHSAVVSSRFSRSYEHRGLKRSHGRKNQCAFVLRTNAHTIKLRASRTYNDLRPLCCG